MKFMLKTLLYTFIIATFTVKTYGVECVESQLTWTPETTLKTKWVSDVQLSPKNDSVLYVVTEAKIIDDKNTFISRIYKTDLSHQKKPFLFSTTDVSSGQPRWSPDGEWIAFVSKRGGSKNIYLIHTEGGEAFPLTKCKKDVQIFSWSPDGKKIAFVMSDETEAEKTRQKTGSNYVYSDDAIVNRLCIIDVFSSNPIAHALTSDAYCVRGAGDLGTMNTEFDWSPDSQKITFAYSPTTGPDSYYLDSALATIDLDTGKISPWKKHAQFEAMPRYSPDGQKIAYISSNSTERYSIDRRVAVRAFNWTQQQLLAPTFNEGPLLAGPNLLGWTKDGKNLIFFEPKGTKFHLVLLSIKGKEAKEIETGDLFFRAPTLSYDRSMIGCVVQTPSTPPEAYVASLNDFQPIQVSNVNQAILAYPKIRTEVVSWISEDGLPIEGLLTYPINYHEGKKYPLLLNVHGGPMSFFDEHFIGIPSAYPLASFAQAGFFILRPNPRGSCGYGKKFRCANYNDWGGGDFIDLMTGVDSLIERGFVDAEKLGIMGWSYGGYMSAWAVTQTSRFKAASIGAGVTNLVSMNGTTDLYRFLTDYLGNVEDNRELYEQRSPINHVKHVTTPCLIEHGIDDKRVPVSQSFEFYRALKRLNKEAVLVLYPGAGHGLPDPKMELDSMQRNLDWFQKHLKP